MEKVFINIHGPICSGKTTVAKALHKKVPKTFHISNDSIKWFVSDYQSKRDRPIISVMVFDIIKKALENGYNVIRPSNMHKESPEQIKMYEDMLSGFGVKRFDFRLDANLSTLLSRYKERLIRAETTGFPIAVKTEEVFMQHYDAYMKAVPNVASFDTESLSAEEIADEILRKIRNA